LIAFNEHLLDDLEPGAVQAQLKSLTQWLSTTALGLDSTRKDWVNNLQLWHKHTPGTPA